MLDIKKLLLFQPFFFSNIIFILTFVFKYKILPLNIIVAICGFIGFYIYPNFYKLFSPYIKPYYLVFYDIIVHYLPLLLIFFFFKKENINWFIISIITLLYIIIVNKYIYQIYFNPTNFFFN